MDSFLKENNIDKKQTGNNIDFFVQYVDWDDIW